MLTWPKWVTVSIWLVELRLFEDWAPWFSALNGDAPLEFGVGKGKVLSFLFEEIEGLATEPLRIVSKTRITLGWLTSTGEADFWRLEAIFYETLSVGFDILNFKAALSMRLNNSFLLLSIVSKHITRKHVFFRLHRIYCLVFTIPCIQVPSHVCFKCAWSHETKAANRASERSFPSVTSLMVTQMSVCCERNLANIALVGLYTFVDAIVNLKIPAFSEKFPANFALKRFNALMSSNVNFQSPCPRVCFLAVRTFKGQLTSVN